MGLDMDLNKVKRNKKGCGLEEIMKVDSYLIWSEWVKKKDYSGSLEEWCGITEDEVDLDLVNEYKNEFVNRFGSFDAKHEYPYKSIHTMICDWRKANQIHNWFVENVQNGVDDCGAYEVSQEQLEDLLEVCTNVLAHSKLRTGKVINGYTIENGESVPIYQNGMVIDDPSYAKEHLPSSSGFFFGSTEYDQWYYEDVKYTKEELEKILKDTDFENEIVFYRSSW